MRIDYDNQKIVWDRDDFVQGFSRSAQSATSNGVSQRYNETGASNMSNIDPFYPQPGLLYPGTGVATLGTANAPSQPITDAALEYSGANFYGISSDINLQKIAVNPQIVYQTGSPWAHPIGKNFTGTAHSGHATAVSSTGAVTIGNRGGTLKLYYSWGDTTDWDVGEFDLTSTFNDDFMSSVPSGPTNPLSGSDLTDGLGKAHPLLYASANRLLIGSGRYTHVYNCSANNLSTKVLTLPVGMEQVGFLEKDYDYWVFATTARGTNYRGRCAAYLWSIDMPAGYYRVIPIPDDECSAPFITADGAVGCFTRSRSPGGRSVLRIFNGIAWEPKYYWTGSLPSIGGVEVQANTVLFQSDGKVHYWGVYAQKWAEAGVQMTSLGGTSNGFIKSFSSADSVRGLFASSGAGTTGGIESFSGYASSSTWRGMLAKPELGLRKKMKIKAVQVSFVGGSSTQIGLQMDLITEAFSGAITVFTGDTGHGGTDSVKTWYQEDFYSRDDTLTSCVTPSFTWSQLTGLTSAPGIQQVEIYYDIQEYVQ